MFIVTSSSVVYNENKDYILVDREPEIKANTKLFKYDFRDYSGIDETELMIATDNLARLPQKK
ncbi:hypothetical protein EJ377_18155 [Chryseobacterium arthrosphaerae]|uniref:Uncharacterized protein n=1 Tax=Chryseobacterium arthrosphaerae TaxID=651561 RepID=A0A3S0QT41_9FLAO|nr:hypothetical protein EJ377_18155 [Chryseobacterium arthrosphaerae]